MGVVRGMSALGKRVATAMVLIPLVVTSVLLLPTQGFAFLIAAVAMLGAWEWARLSGCTSTISRLAYVIGIGALLWLSHTSLITPKAYVVVFLAACLWWLLATAWIIQFQRAGALELLSSNAIRLAAGCMSLVPAWAGLVYLHGYTETGPQTVLFLFVLIWSADIGAYFVGRRFGRYKLASKVSPGKTWEGVLGGFLAVMGIALASGIVTGMTETRLIGFIALCVVTAVVSVLGDLIESLLKRRENMKDSGRWLPGHGGLLDRIDSLTAAAPVFALGVLLSGGRI